MGGCYITQGAQICPLWQPRRMAWGGGRKEVQKGGDVNILTVDSLCYMAETNTIL